ncbi:MAG: integrase family protein [Verrucomicrobiaceae bacterium]|nr:integrase family protein [Verrucomicrobiaceae bacterium]
MPKKAHDHPLPSRWDFKHGAYYYRTRHDDRALFDNKSWFRLGTSYPEALRAFADRKELEIGDTVASVIDRYRLDRLPKLKPQTRTSYGAALELLNLSVGANKCATIQPQAVYQYLDVIAKNRTMNVANMQLKMINIILDCAVRWGVVPKNLIKGEVSYFGKRDGLVLTRDRYVEDWELAAWQEKATPVQRAFAAVVMLTGARKSDVLQTVLQDDRETGLHIIDRKTDKATTFRWTLPLRAAVDLARSIRHGNSMFLFTNRDGNCFVSSDGRTQPFDKAWRRTMQLAISDPENPLKVPFTRHDLRAKVGSDAASEQRAQEILGHSNVSMTRKHYRRGIRVIDPTK